MRSLVAFCLWSCFVFAFGIWKENPPVLQNQDTLYFNFDQNFIPFSLEPFVPPKSQNPLQKNHLLEAPKEFLIPQINPNPLKVPDFVLKPTPVYEKDFIVSYKFLVKNEIPQGEKYNISEPLSAMKPNLVLDYSCQIDVFLDDDIEIPDVLDILLKKILIAHKNEVLDCLYKSGVHIEDNGLLHNNRAKHKTLLSIMPKRIKVSLQNGFLILKVFKEIE